MVIGRAVIVDLARGPQLVRSLNLVQGVGGIAPIVAPLLGGIVLQLSDWRAPFWVIAVITAVTAVVVWFVVPESLPPHRRHAGGCGPSRARRARCWGTVRTSGTCSCARR